jgi:hypothetical protein
MNKLESEYLYLLESDYVQCFWGSLLPRKLYY